MKIICAWCEKELNKIVKGCISGSVIALPSGVETSHGICPECAQKVVKEYEESKLEVKK